MQPKISVANVSVAGEPSDFDRFQSLAKRILTTPKAALVKDEPKAKPTKKPVK